MLNTPNETRLPVHAQVLDWLARQQQAMQDLLQKVVNICLLYTSDAADE